MNQPSPTVAVFRTAIEQFIKERLDARLDKLGEDGSKREELIAQHETTAWLGDAARRIAQIAAVTHTLKPIHPEARGTNLYRRPDALPSRPEIGSHALLAGFSADVVGNAAALDVYKLMKLDLGGSSLFDRLRANDADTIAALSADAAQARTWAIAFLELVRQDSAAPASHTRAKQLYWLTGANPLDDGDYLLLAPLYASSLAHAVYRTINEDRFGDDAKAARQAHRDGSEHPTGYRTYPNLAIQKLGGTKPQNISQLNSERRGDNYLLSSLPPSWKSREVRAPWATESIFRRYGQLPDVRTLAQELRTFLLTRPPANIETRDRVGQYLDGLIGELVLFAAGIQSGLPAGWSADARCDLVDFERLWLDPGRTALDEDFDRTWQAMDWPDAIGRRFGNWLNARLGPDLPVGDAEQREWTRELLLDEDGWAWQLRAQRNRVRSPSSVSATEVVS